MTQQKVFILYDDNFAKANLMKFSIGLSKMCFLLTAAALQRSHLNYPSLQKNP